MAAPTKDFTPCRSQEVMGDKEDRRTDADLKLHVLYRDDDYLIVDKPYDVRIDGNFDVTLEKLVYAQYPDISRVWLVHQLDYATSGVICLGLSKQATAAACKLFAERKVDKQYLAMVFGHVTVESATAAIRVLQSKVEAPAPPPPPPPHSEPDELKDEGDRCWKCRGAASATCKVCNGTGVLKRSNRCRKSNSGTDSSTAADSKTHVNITPGEESSFMLQVPVAELGADDFRMAIGNPSNPGLASSTNVRILQHGTFGGKPVTRVLLEPHTGRRHQLRIHMLAIGHPIVGDATYSGDESSPRMMLHAFKLTLPLPAPRKTISVETTDPFAALLTA